MRKSQNRFGFQAILSRNISSWNVVMFGYKAIFALFFFFLDLTNEVYAVTGVLGRILVCIERTRLRSFN